MQFDRKVPTFQRHLLPPYLLSTLMIKTAGTSKTLITIYKSKWCHIILEDCNLDTHCHENQQSCMFLSSCPYMLTDLNDADDI
jgi:hypothetical protein